MSSTPSAQASSPAPAHAAPDAPFRVGHGYDLHRLEPFPPEGKGRPFILGGVAIAHDRGPVGHSDGDALLHALTDALLGALAMPDIGQLFPDTDPRHDGQDSADFLIEAARRVAQAGWAPVNVDCTVILERPKLSPHKETMRQNMARLVGIDASRVNIKGKTHERVDAVGEGRAIEVHVVCLLARLPAALS